MFSSLSVRSCNFVQRYEKEWKHATSFNEILTVCMNFKGGMGYK